MEKKQKTKLQHALNYAKTLKWAVLPCHYMVNINECSCGNKRKKGGKFDCSAGKHPATDHGFKEATKDQKKIREWWMKNPSYNIGVRTGEESNLFVVDVDLKNDGPENIKKLCEKYGNFDSTARAKTGSGGKHILFKYPKDGKKWGNSNKNLPEGIDIRGEGGFIVVEPSNHESGSKYKWLKDFKPGKVELADAPEWFLSLILTKPSINGHSTSIPDVIAEGGRNQTLTSIAGKLRHGGLDEESIKDALIIANQKKCSPPLGQDEVERIVKSVSRYEQGKKSEVKVEWDSLKSSKDIKVSKGADLPEPLGNQAYYGVIGNFVQDIKHLTEASPEAILLQATLSVGNLLGRGPRFYVNSSVHYCNLYGLVMGKTARGRKGMSKDIARVIGKGIDETWDQTLNIHGLSSGEGLVSELSNGGGEFENRLMIWESEFSRVMTAICRENNTLSAVLRQGWDSEDIYVKTRKEPLTAKNPHVSMIGHITLDEFKRKLNSVDISNGFANRFLIYIVEKYQSIASGHKIIDANYCKMHTEVIKAVVDYFDFKKKVVNHSSDLNFNFSKKADRLFAEVYNEWDTREYRGIMGDLLARPDPNVRRISMLIAATNGYDEIKLPHLEAALEMWRYHEDSVEILFGDITGEYYSDNILAELELRYPDYMSQTQISKEIFSRNANQAVIKMTTKTLLKRGEIAGKRLTKEKGPQEICYRFVPHSNGRKMAKSKIKSKPVKKINLLKLKRKIDKKLIDLKNIQPKKEYSEDLLDEDLYD